MLEEWSTDMLCKLSPNALLILTEDVQPAVALQQGTDTLYQSQDAPKGRGRKPPEELVNEESRRRVVENEPVPRQTRTARPRWRSCLAAIFL